MAELKTFKGFSLPANISSEIKRIHGPTGEIIRSIVNSMAINDKALKYQLSYLDSSNITEINTSTTNITSGDERLVIEGSLISLRDDALVLRLELGFNGSDFVFNLYDDEANVVLYLDGDGNPVFNGLNIDGDIEISGDIIHETVTTNGFDLEVSTSLGDLSWTQGTRTFSIAVQGGESNFYFWCNGQKITKTTTQSVVIPDTTSTYYVYFDNAGVLQYVAYTSVTNALFYEYAIVGLVYWNATAGTGLAGNEQHGIRMSSATHWSMHFGLGALYHSGMDITGLTDADPNYTNTTSGQFSDEDIKHNPVLQATHPFIYRLGDTGEWTGSTPDNNVALDMGGSYHVWNEWTGSTWQLTEGGNQTDYWITFFIATPHIDGYMVKKIVGQNAYPNRAEARNAIESEMNTLKLEGLPSPEIVFLYALIVRRNGDLEDLADGSLYYDLRVVKGGTGGESSSATLAANVQTDVTNFNGILSATDTDVQTALETIDDLVVENITPNTEPLTLTATNISNKYVDLAQTPNEKVTVDVFPVGGIRQTYTTDFTIITDGATDKRLNWNGLGLESLLLENDILIVNYLY